MAADDSSPGEPKDPTIRIRIYNRDQRLAVANLGWMIGKGGNTLAVKPPRKSGDIMEEMRKLIKELQIFSFIIQGIINIIPSSRGEYTAGPPNWLDHAHTVCVCDY